MQISFEHIGRTCLINDERYILMNIRGDDYMFAAAGADESDETKWIHHDIDYVWRNVPLMTASDDSRFNRWLPISEMTDDIKEGNISDACLMLRYEGDGRSVDIVTEATWNEDLSRNKPRPHWKSSSFSRVESLRESPTHFMLLTGPYGVIEP